MDLPQEQAAGRFARNALTRGAVVPAGRAQWANEERMYSGLKAECVVRSLRDAAPTRAAAAANAFLL